MAKTETLNNFVRQERRRLVGFVASLARDLATPDAEDVVQDVLIRLLERPERTEAVENLAAYVYQSLRNRVTDLRRRPVQYEAGDGDELSDDTQDLFAGLLKEERREQLFAALASLSDAERKVIVGHVMEGRTFRDMSEDWGIPIGTLLSHKSRALRKLDEWHEGDT